MAGEAWERTQTKRVWDLASCGAAAWRFVQGAKVCDGCHNPYMIMSSTPTTLRSSELDAEACCDRIAIIL